jgi:hypothetical protein
VTSTDGAISGLVQFTEEDDLDMALYYLRAISNILRWAPDAVWAVLARKTVSSEAYFPSLSQISKLCFPPPKKPVADIWHSRL